jgi:hypothetical protein
MDYIDFIIAYESGDLTGKQLIEFFSKLVKDGMAYTLQGHYGRMATTLIENGILADDGTILVNLEDYE